MVVSEREYGQGAVHACVRVETLECLTAGLDQLGTSALRLGLAKTPSYRNFISDFSTM
jgi:hypothetical protein